WIARNGATRTHFISATRPGRACAKRTFAGWRVGRTLDPRRLVTQPAPLMVSTQVLVLRHAMLELTVARPDLEISMPLPRAVLAPPFNITRASHVVLGVTDLAASCAFYRDLIGFIVTDEDADSVYLRGLEEASHHSLVIRRAARPVCERIGLRV